MSAALLPREASPTPPALRGLCGWTAGVLAANVIISVCSTCLYSRQLYALEASPAFSVQLDAGIQVVICACLLGLLDACGWARRRGQPPIPLPRWLELSLWLSLQDTLEIASIDSLGSANGDLVPVMQQAVIPITLGLSIALLGKRYRLTHWAAAALVIGGIATSYAPMAASDAKAGVRWGAALLYLVSRVFQSMANVRCETVVTASPGVKAEAGAEAGAEARPAAAARRAERWMALRTVLRAGFWTGLLGLGLNVLSSLALAAARGQPAAAVFADYVAGAECLLNTNGTAAAGPNATAWQAGAAVGEAGGGLLRSNASGAPRCASAAAATAAFALPGVLFAVSEFQVIQHASASTYFLLMALELPIQAAALASAAIMGPLASAAHPSLFWGIPLIALGLASWARAERDAAHKAVSTQRQRLEAPLAALSAGGAGCRDAGSVNGEGRRATWG